MPTATPKPSPRDRREFYRITDTLPICIQLETDQTEGEFTERSVNLSGGGIGVVVNQPYQPNEILSLTLRLPDEVVFKASMEVLRVDPLPGRKVSYRLHARFVGLTSQNRELLIRHILRLQRDRLKEHYSA